MRYDDTRCKFRSRTITIRFDEDDIGCSIFRKRWIVANKRVELRKEVTNKIDFVASIVSKNYYSIRRMLKKH